MLESPDPQIDIIRAIFPTLVAREHKFAGFFDDAFRGGGLNVSAYKEAAEQRENDIEELGDAYAFVTMPICHSPNYLTPVWDSWLSYKSAPQAIVDFLVPPGMTEADPNLQPGHLRVLFPSLLYIYLIGAVLCARLAYKRLFFHAVKKDVVVKKGADEPIDRPTEITFGQDRDENFDDGTRLVERMWGFGVVGVAGVVMNLSAIMLFNLAHLPYISHAPSTIQPTFFTLIWPQIWQASASFYNLSLALSIMQRWSPNLRGYLQGAFLVSVFTAFYLQKGDILFLVSHFWLVAASFFAEGFSRFLGHTIANRMQTAVFFLFFVGVTMFSTFALSFAGICFGLSEASNTPMHYMAFMHCVAVFLITMYTDDKYYECRMAEEELRKEVVRRAKKAE